MYKLKRVAIVHDWLTVYAGAERVLEQLLVLFPQADLFSVCDFLPQEERMFLGGRTPRTTFIQNLPAARYWYRNYLPLMPLAIEQLDLSQYDLVISSSHAVAKGVLTGPNQIHVSYVHTPIRYAWDLQHQYLNETGFGRGLKGWLARYFLHRIRTWDVCRSNSVDVYVANSNFVAKRIWKLYRRTAAVIHPPVDIALFEYKHNKQDFYLTASRLVPYKRVDLIVKAFLGHTGRRLKVVGEGPELNAIKRIAAGNPNIEILGYQTPSKLSALMGDARAFIYAAEDDFGIVPVEAQACGTPVIAFGRGGVLETIRGLDLSKPTGVFYFEQTKDALIEAVDYFEAHLDKIQHCDCRMNAERFSAEQFSKLFIELVDRLSF